MELWPPPASTPSHVDFGSDIGALSFVNRINKLDCKQQWFGKGHVAVKGEK
jgi:hypothetical protein